MGNKEMNYRIECREIVVPAGARIKYDLDSSNPRYIILNDLSAFISPDPRMVAAHQLLRLGMVKIGMLEDLAITESIEFDTYLSAGDKYVLMVAHLY